MKHCGLIYFILCLHFYVCIFSIIGWKRRIQLRHELRIAQIDKREVRRIGAN